MWESWHEMLFLHGRLLGKDIAFLLALYEDGNNIYFLINDGTKQRVTLGACFFRCKVQV